MESEGPQRRNIGIGIQLASADPFWVVVRESAYARAHELGVRVVSRDLDLQLLTGDEQVGWLEELLAQDLNALVVQGIDQALARPVLEAGVPLIVASESDVHHPLATSPNGLYDIAQQLGRQVAERLAGQGRILVLGGLVEGFERGYSRLHGLLQAMKAFPGIRVGHIPTPWAADAAREYLSDALAELGYRPDAIIGLSDLLALAARDVGRNLGLVDERTLVAGFNGDLLAVAGVLSGSMFATADIMPNLLGRQLVDIAYRAGLGEPLTPHFGYHTRLITADNAAAAASEKLVALAALPSLLSGFSRDLEQRRVTQLNTSLAIGQRIGSLLDRQQLRHEIADEIRANYGYDDLRLFLWSERDKQLVPDMPGEAGERVAPIPLAEAGLLAYTLLRNRPTFIADAQHSAPYPPDSGTPDCRSRVILPIRFGKELLGLLDLRSRHSTDHSQLDLVGLQVLSDQLGVAMRNARLYGEALASRAAAERASLVKSHLLINVSHELRTPVNIIQGYSQTALTRPDLYGITLPAALIEDFGHIWHSAEHLGRLINDLLDLSRAEIDELEIIPEPIATRSFLEDVFESFTASVPREGAVAWRLEVPAELPELQADALRLRQILFNLLSNAAKFTQAGHITVGAQVEAPDLHLWVEDTGCGIAPELQQRIFEAFAAAEQPRRPGQGIGLGLRLTHELVRLHGGNISAASEQNVGSTFHIYLPLRSRGEALPARAAPRQPAWPAALELPTNASRISRQAVGYLREHYADSETRGQIAEQLGVSVSYLTRIFRHDLGLTPSEYLTRLRIERAKELLCAGNLTITEVASQAGYNDAAYFSRVFRQETGQNPLAFRRHTH